MKKIRLLFVLPTLKGGGAERITCNLANTLDKNIFDVNIFLFNKKGEYWKLIDENVNIFFASKEKNVSKIQIIKSMYKVAKNMDIIVGAMELTPTYISTMISILLKKKVIGWVHINIDSILNDKSKYIRLLHKYILIKLFYNKLDKIITVSNGVKENIREYLKEKNKNKIKCIYNPIKFDYIRKKSGELLEEELEHPLIMGIGRLEQQKNFISLINAHKLLLDRGIKQNLIILGQGSQQKYLSNEIKKLNLEKSVRLLGFKENPYKYLKKADVFVQSSIYEGLPTVLIEALALDVPVVATNCPNGAEEILDNGKYGLLVNVNDDKALADGIEKLLFDDEIINKFKNNSIKAIERFDDKIITKIFEKNFLELIWGKNK